MNKIIVFETTRLFLRQYKDEDFSALHSIFSEEETMRYYPAPFSMSKTYDWIERNQSRYKSDGFGLWAVCLKETGQLIGDYGLVKQTIDGRIEVEVGYHTNKRFWSKGFATEAALACKASKYCRP
ncbi:hypothetical protein GCM10010916_04730 [Paenibacillus abyssi]|uniref:N-acetyltransferase domain-containing protein n=1 Tax=Paenibacillus abyssi TaxID=1340531 RepID=A0A917FMZ9_9BACL|nr:hypothetical protein GCM10010916_04730 [Paenibacillus abyssi]